MNKFLDDISEFKVVDRLKEKLQESENLKLEIEAVLIKRVGSDEKHLINDVNFLSHFFFFCFLNKEYSFDGTNGRMGSI